MLHSHASNQLLELVSPSPNAMPRSMLHGFLTGIAWHVLFRNKQEHTNAALREIAADTGRDWYPLTEADECVLEAAMAAENALESTLNWIAELATNPRSDLFFRSSVGKYKKCCLH